MANNKTIGEKYYIHSVVIAVMLFFFYIFGFQNSFFYSSILEYKGIKSDKFDGTVYPLEYVPNPIELTYEQRKQRFEYIDSKFFIKTPIYNPNIFGKDIENLQPGTKEYSDVMTQRLIFTVPYIGTYNFDYKEFTGSHPGVDIIAPEGTPVRNIAAGLVVDIGYQPAGFGNYVLVKHSGVNLPNGNIGDIYSLYAHMSKISDIEVGKKIKKADLIGYVGQTGTATTPHLHFQIDSQTAPFSPYWPFTTSEMKAAKVGFFDGINIGLGKENAILYTISPLKFVNDNLSQVLFTSNESIPKENTPIIEENNDVKKEDIITENNTKKEIENTNSLSGQENNIDTGTNIVENNSLIIENNKTQVIEKQTIVKKDVELLSALNANDLLLKNDIKGLSLNDSNLLALSEDEIKDLSNSLNKINSDTGILQDNSFELKPLLPETNTGSIETQTGTTEQSGSVIETGSLNLELENSGAKIFSDIEDNYKYLEELKYFKQNNIISGFIDNTFRPKNKISRIEALKMILLANSIQPIKDLDSKFVDIKTLSWENTYINSGIKNNVISTSNKYFYPFNNVSRIEALKLILTLGKVDFTGLKDDLTFSDVNKTDWFYKYVNYAIKNNLFDDINSDKFQPNKPLNREELIRILYKYINK